MANIISLRQNANRQILAKIGEVVEQCPDWRFGQILANLNIIEYERDYINDVCTPKDIFYEESVVTLKRITNN